MKEVMALTDDDKGVWQVKTEASSYLIDLDERQFLRNPGGGMGAHPDIPDRKIVVSDLSSLFPDSQWQPLIAIGVCEVGKTMLLYGTDSKWVCSTIVREIKEVYPND